MSSEELYRLMLAYVRERGWERENEGEGWWWRDDQDDLHLLEEAVGIELAKDLDLRVEL